MKRLANGSEARRLEGRLFNVVESHHGDILRNAQAGIMEGTNATDRGNVVKGNNGSEAAMMGQQLLQDRISQLGRGQVFFQLDSHFGPDGEAEILRHLNDTLPPCVGVGAIRLSAHEYDVAVPQFVKMTQR